MPGTPIPRDIRPRGGSSGTHGVVPAARPVFGRPVFPGRSERTRSALSYLSGASISRSPLIEPLLRTVRENAPEEDLSVLQRAFAVADRQHEGQKRKSGDPYITHPVAVTTILAELGMTGSVLVAALLHDTVEDTDYTLEELTADFGEEVAHLVDGVTKLEKVQYGEHAQAETVRKMIVAMAQDIRVLLIKLADRLHNARTWRFVSQESSSKKARETLEIFAPLAHRLGLNTIKWELEDLSFAALYPKIYDEIVRMVGERQPQRERNLAEIRALVAEDLAESGIDAVITGRPKHYYSVYQKMIVRGKDFDEIHDLLAVRVLVSSVRECYAALGSLHARWRPLPGRFKDYIAMPKFNMYQSLHTTVLGPGGRPVEIQIRTHEMHRRAEYGVAAHWKYKDHARKGNRGETPRASSEDMGWLKSLVSWQDETKDSTEFLDSLRYEIDTKEVYVFTPRGDVMALPAGSTPVDFAYAVHTEVGHKTIGARVNGKLVALSSTLQHGDWVEVLTSKSEDAAPSQDWLKFVSSPRARQKIKQFFSKERREEAITRGQEALTRALRKHHLPLQRTVTQEGLVSVAQQLNKSDITALYEAIGNGTVSSREVVDLLVESAGGADGSVEDLVDNTSAIRPVRQGIADSGVAVDGASDVYIKLARCCTPVPPDDIVGFVTRGQGISVHRTDCPNMRNQADSERKVAVHWAPTQSSVFLVEIQVEALDRQKLLSDVTRVLSENHVNILSANVHTSSDRLAISRFSFEMGDARYLDHVLNQVRNIDGVYDVYRTSSQQRLPETPRTRL
ncbi:bifunctional (p)ppGpp synthetase/guanosine-3',5'-bis(diphosphate) 3'-pyrophosphohydrolase [Kocuria coralli]|uniref:Bifunctional (P)ppGpp synthetase/guanosine-3',5'-bis(Diphosphate) 3'-pyrophosphohydrolase n=1 Tax=Kocuria coralli TaxID=1461025 RepID=A0A5J5L002_9MICC|nr:bifunctional (p)ppGpp synthetase/guanosine-3',5'-bis(diphosphate) 3'-pyrophosphohydrolase [Kocuria coralli]